MVVNFVNHSLDKTQTGGVNRATIDLANALVDRGIDVRLISLGKIDSIVYETNPNITITSLEMDRISTVNYKHVFKAQWLYSAYKNIRLLFKQSNSPQFWIFTSPPLCILGSILKLEFNKQIILGHEHTTTHYSKGPIVDHFKYKLYKKLDTIIALTHDDYDNYTSLGIPSTYIPNFYNTFDTDSNLSSSNKRKYLLYVGRFSSEKRPLKALEIYLQSKLFNNDVHLRMFGHGKLEPEIRHFIKKHELDEYVEVLTNVTDPDLIYQDGYALILTSKIEGFGMVLIEAISRDIPCIAFDVLYGPRNIITDNINGHLVEDNNNAQFINKLTSSNLIELQQKPIHHTIREFSKDTVVDKWINLFKRLASV